MRTVPLILSLLVILLATGCAKATFRWQPSLTSQVPDGTPVRFKVARGEPRASGQALDWQRGAPRVITPRGDTVSVPDTAFIQVRLKNKTNHAVAGAIAGFVVGVGVSWATCAPPKTHCGEQDPTPMLAAGLGALIGSLFKADHWVRVRWDAR